MKERAYEILGKTIIGIYIKYSKHDGIHPKSQLHLVFDDYSCYEFYCYNEDIRPTNGLWPNSSFDHVSSYMKDAYFLAYRAVIDPDSDEVAYEVHDRS